MRTLFVIIVAVFFTSCREEKLFNDVLDKVIIDYQEKFPIPDETIIKDNHKSFKPIYLYVVKFYLQNNDTLISIMRPSSGLVSPFKGYGIYQNDKLAPTAIIDENKLSDKFVLKKEYNQMINEYKPLIDKDYPEGFPPVYNYIVKNGKVKNGKVKNGKVKLIKIDTVWNKWD